MGGKTHQRVAGNVKPSRSERMRDLMINKHGTGNIITFSTLSNKEPTQRRAPSPLEISQENLPQVATNSSTNDKQTLIVKRVGNRDFFTRVRVPKDVSNQFDSDVVDKSQDNTGMLDNAKSASSQYNEDGYSPAILQDKKSCDDSEQSSTGVNINEDEGSAAAIQQPKYNFDTLIAEIQIIEDQIIDREPVSIDIAEDNEMVKEVQLMKLLGILVKDFWEDMSIEEWDLIFRSIQKWIGSIVSSNYLLTNLTRNDFCLSVFRFIYQLTLLAKMWSDIENPEEKFPMWQLLLDDWKNFRSSSIYKNLFILYLKLSMADEMNEEQIAVAESLVEIVIDVDPKLIMNDCFDEHLLAGELEFDPDFELPENSIHCTVDETKFSGFLGVCSLLKSKYRVISIVAHSILSKIMPMICEDAQTSLNISDLEDVNNLSIVPPASLMSILTTRDLMISALLSDYQVGDISVTIDPNSDSYSCSLVYLMTWDLMIQFITGVEKEVGHCLIYCLKKLGSIQRLLDNVFMLLPPMGERDSLRFQVEDNNSRNISPKNLWNLSDFLKSPLKMSPKRPVNEIELAALHIYFSVARFMPVTVRKWYNNNSNKKLCNLVNEYTVKHISKVICSLEMETVLKQCQNRANEDKLKNLAIKARPSANEVYTVYTRDEFRLELTIKLPTNYPLGPVQIDGGKRVGVTDLKWRSWLLQLTLFLSHQNGPILDGIDLWRRNIDKRFEGIEKCMICFSILHSNYQLPKKKCQTCSKMFHNLCLYKWFDSSGNSTCPLCRNTW